MDHDSFGCNCSCASDRYFGPIIHHSQNDQQSEIIHTSAKNFLSSGERRKRDTYSGRQRSTAQTLEPC